MEIAYTATEYMLDQCAAACKQDGFTYYAMDSGVNCWCAINAPDASHVDNTMCSACADDASRTCGNVHYGFMSVYHIAPSKFVLPSLDGVHTLGARSVSTVLSTDAHHVDKHRVTGEPLKKKISHKAHSDDDDDDDDDDEHRHRHSHLNRLRRMRRLRRLMRMRRAKHEHDDDDEHEHRHHEKEDD
jgi:hypothetical protein